mgnify:FL=1
MNKDTKAKLIIIAFITTLILATLITSRNNNKRLIKELQQSNKELEQQVEDIRNQYNNLYDLFILLGGKDE